MRRHHACLQFVLLVVVALAMGDESDVDWDAVAVVALDRGVDAAVVVDRAVAVVQKPRNHSWKFWLPCQQKRSPEQHALAAARMRDARHNLQMKKMDASIKLCLRSAGLFGRATRVCGKLVVTEVAVANASNKKRHLQVKEMLDISYSPITNRADVARAFGIHPKTVTRLRSVTAFLSWKADLALLQGIAESFRQCPPAVFVCSASCDATKERLSLPIHSGLLKAATTSAWNVMVANSRFAWAYEDDRRPWYQCDFVRMNVPVMSDAAECLHEAMYELPVTKGFSELEIVGAQKASVAIAHWDLDGHPANMRTAYHHRHRHYHRHHHHHRHRHHHRRHRHHNRHRHHHLYR